MIKIKCPLCQGKNHQKLYRKDGFGIVECLDCNLVFVNPRLSVSEIRGHYNKKYYQSNDPTDKTRYTDYNFRYLKDKEKIRFESIFKNLEEFLPEKGRFLDVGAATGFLVLEANKKGWQAEGVEISKWATDYGKNKLKIQIHYGDIFKAKFKPESFSVVTMLDILEHLEDPLKELKEAYRTLKRGGIIYVETINFDNFVTKRIIGKKYKHMVPAFHLIYFGRCQLREFLIKANFTILKEDLTSTSVDDYEYECFEMY